jgi:very-short-patch-repair endonuclease
MENDFICKFCGKPCKNANSLRNHERLCKENPNRDEHSLKVLAENRYKWNAGHDAWNKGKTKETDERIAKYAKTNSINQRGENSSWFGRKHTDETKAKIAAKQKENYRGISRYATVREQRKSYAEEYFETIFTDAEMQYHVDRYFLDFAWPKSKIYIEIDGEQHYEDQGVVQHDKERTENLAKSGWRLLKRIRWSEFQKLSFTEKENEIFRLKQTLKIQNS